MEEKEQEDDRPPPLRDNRYEQSPCPTVPLTATTLRPKVWSTGKLKEWVDAASIQGSTSRPVVSRRNGESGKELVVLTFNVLMTVKDLSERIHALVTLIIESNADIVCMQEVKKKHVRAIVRDPRIRKRYYVSDATGDTVQKQGVRRHGLFILSLFPIQRIHAHPIPSHSTRYCLIVEVDVPVVVEGKEGSKNFVLATAHLESAGERHEKRKEQVEEIVRLVKDYSDVIVMMDTNFVIEEEANPFFDASFIDAWQMHVLLKKREGVELDRKEGLTFDSDQNSMIGWEQHDRLDRAYLRSDHWHVKEATVVGKHAIPLGGDKHTFISDHFGLLVTLHH